MTTPTPVAADHGIQPQIIVSATDHSIGHRSRYQLQIIVYSVFLLYIGNVAPVRVYTGNSRLKALMTLL